MTDDPGAAGDPGLGRSDLYARIQDLQDGVDQSLTAAQVEHSVRTAVSDFLPGLIARAVSEAVSGSLADALRASLPSLVADTVESAVVPSVALAIAENQRPEIDEQLEARLAALEDALDGVGDRIESMARDGVSSTSASLEELRQRVEAMARTGASSSSTLDDLRAKIDEIAEGGDDRSTDAQRAEMDALRVDMANALDYVRSSLVEQIGGRLDRVTAAWSRLEAGLDELREQDPAAIAEQLSTTRAAVAEVGASVDELRAQGPAIVLARLEALDAALGRNDVAGLRTDLATALERLDALQGALASGPPEVDLGPLHERLDEVQAAVEGGREVVDLGPLHERLDEVQAAVEGGREVVDLGPLHERLDEVQAAVEGGREVVDLGPLHERLDLLQVALTESRTEPVDLEPLRLRLDALDSTLVGLRPEPIDVQPLHDKLDAIWTGLAPTAADDLTPILEKLDALAASAGPDLSPVQERLDAVVAAFRDGGSTDAVAALESRLEEVDGHVAAARGALDGLQGTIEERLDGLASVLGQQWEARLEPMRSTILELAARPVDRGDNAPVARLEEVLGAIDASSGVTGDRIAVELERQTATVVQSVRDAVTSVGQPDGQVLAQLEAVRSELTAVLDRVSSFEPSSVSPVELDALRGDLADALAAVPALVRDALPVADGRVVEGLAEVRADIATVAAETLAPLALLEGVRSELTAVLDRVSSFEPSSVSPVELDALRGDLADALAAVPALVRDALPVADGRVVEGLAEVRADIATVAAETLAPLALLEGVRSELTAVLDRVSSFEPSSVSPVELDALRGDLADALEAVPALVRDALPVPDDRLLAGIADIRAEIAALTSGSPQGDAEVRSELEALGAKIEAQSTESRSAREQELTELRAELAALRDDVAGGPLIGVRDDVSALGTHVEALVAALPDDSAPALDAVRVEIEGLAARLDIVTAALPEHAEALAASGAGLDDLAQTIRSVPEQVEAWRADADDDRRRMAEALRSLDLARDDMTALIEQIREQGTAAADAVKEASLESLNRVKQDTQRAVTDLRTEIDAARSALDEHVRSLREQVGEHARAGTSLAMAEVQAALTAQAEEANATRAEMERIATRVQSAGRLLVAYLGERDVALEEVRDRATAALLDDVLSGLGRKERDRATEHARGVFARRREGRQAERWRRHRETGTDAGLQADDQALLEMLDAPAVPAASSQALEKQPVPRPTPVPAPPARVTATAPSRAPTTPVRAPQEAAAEEPAATSPVRAPQKPAATAPAKAPQKVPAKAPVKVAAKAPVKAPRKVAAPPPVKAPQKVAAKAPVKAPQKVAAKAPVKAPQKVAAKAPVKVAAKAPAKAPQKVAAKAPQKSAAKAPAKASAATAKATVRPARTTAAAAARTERTKASRAGTVAGDRRGARTR